MRKSKNFHSFPIFSDFAVQNGISDPTQLGLTRADVKSPWTWSDGTPVNYTNWDTVYCYDGGDCTYAELITLDSYPLGTWHAFNQLNSEAYVICQKPAE